MSKTTRRHGRYEEDRAEVRHERRKAKREMPKDADEADSMAEEPDEDLDIPWFDPASGVYNDR